ncbi:hypothetical protein BDW72DRAFT_199765 [Aspergillus terricola var. indicus]
MPFTRLLFLFLTLFSTLSISQPSSTIIELDQLFPRNRTYAPLRYFPLVWGLQNATTAYPLGFKLYWRLSLADSAVYVAQGEGFCPEEEHMADSYSDGPAPSDPVIFNEFPISLRNFSTGRWKLEWKFGFDYNCSLVDPGTPDRHYRKQPYQSVVFTIAKSGKSIDLLRDWDCEAERKSDIDSAIAFDTSPPHYLEPDQNCPVVNRTTPNRFEKLTQLNRSPCLRKRVEMLKILMNKREGFYLPFQLLKIRKFAVFVKRHVFIMFLVQLSNGD